MLQGIYTENEISQFLGDTIYFPHNIDFRGRAYPIPPHLNHIGNDLSRGLLIFAESKPLGERGLRWLQIHLANLYGYDKANFDERVQFVQDHLDDIYDSATKPLEVSFHVGSSRQGEFTCNARADAGGFMRTILGSVLVHAWSYMLL